MIKLLSKFIYIDCILNFLNVDNILKLYPYNGLILILQKFNVD